MVNNMKKRIVFLGAPGTGKGTVSQLLETRLGYKHLSLGDIFRTIAQEKTELGEMVSRYLLEGKYVPPEITNPVIKEVVGGNLKNLTDTGFILDGYPRTFEQVKYLDTLTPIDAAVLFDASDIDAIIKRVSGRLICPKCQTIYNIYSELKPKVDNLCDFDQTTLLSRKDDSANTLSHRIEIYNEAIDPVINFYQDKKLLFKVDANEKLEAIYQTLVNFLGAN